ncbi:MAG: YbaK/EbsC family protein [Clostridia bacterium]|nr:YbaK/EbsC family protein [Clostridia bacterium]
MSIETVTEYLRERGAADKIRRFDVSSATVALAAQALGCEEARIAKTMSFLVDGCAVLIVCAGDAKVNSAKFKATFHTKAKMLTAEQLAELVGHAPGGVCPFAVNEGCVTWLDESLKRFDIVYPAAGNAASAVELTVEELERYSRSAGWVDVCVVP